MQLTPNYKLKKPEGTDPVDIQDFNDNADLIDAALKKKAESSGGDISGMTVKTLDDITTEFPVPVAGESTKTFLGKVKKFFSDTKNWMTGVCLIGQIVNNCVTNNAKLPLSAAQGKVLMDLYNVLNTNLEGYYKLSGGTAIPNGANLTGYKTPGNYYCPNNTVAASLTGSPTKKAFTLKVELSTGNSYPCQTIRDFATGKIYFRTFNIDTNAWSEWGYSIQNADMESKQITSTTDSNGLVSVGAKYPDYKKVVCTTTRTATIMHVYHNDSEWRAKAVDTSNNAIANATITINCIAFK